MKPWYEEAFGEFYLQLYAHRDADEARRAMDLLFDESELAEARVLDLACGAGRHLPEIARKGGRALGMDLSMPLLREASRHAANAGLVRADMRRLPLRDRSVDWVLSFFTSFGYFEDLEAHRRLAAEWARVATRGLVLDVHNPAPLTEGLVPRSRRHQGDYRIEESRKLERDPQRVVKEVRVFSTEGKTLLQYQERVLLFDPAQLITLLDQAGWVVTHRYGDYDGSSFDVSRSPRQILRCRRKEAGR